MFLLPEKQSISETFRRHIYVHVHVWSDCMREVEYLEQKLIEKEKLDIWLISLEFFYLKSSVCVF